MMVIDGSLMYFAHINPYELNDDDWAAAYNSIKYVVEQQNKNNK